MNSSYFHLRQLTALFATPLCIAVIVWAPFAAAQTSHKTFSSGKEPVALVELFTSQGCSSCPPAESWMGKLQDDPRLWKEIVPVTWHVSYWDYLGWKDPYASDANSHRQRNYQRYGNVSRVYTPGFVVGGQEWRGWFRRQPLPGVGSTKGGSLDVSVNNGFFNAKFEGKGEALNIAVLGFDLSTKVNAGENHGRKLDGHFVVLNHQQLYRDSRSKGSWEGKLPDLKQYPKGRKALAVWVADKGGLSPVQATGGWLQ